MNRKAIFLSSSISGFYIFIASYIFLLRNGDTVAKFLFSFGLLSCLALETPLFTGTVGNIHQPHYFLYNYIVLMGNIFGCYIASILLPAQTNNYIIINKLSQNRMYAFFLAIVCGAIICTAVHEFRKKNDSLIVILSVTAFLSVHAEHSIADIAFVLMTRTFSVDTLLFLSIIIVGNAIGAVITHYILSFN